MGELPNMLDLSNVADGSTFVVGGRLVRGARPGLQTAAPGGGASWRWNRAAALSQSPEAAGGGE